MKRLIITSAALACFALPALAAASTEMVDFGEAKDCINHPISQLGMNEISQFHQYQANPQKLNQVLTEFCNKGKKISGSVGFDAIQNIASEDANRWVNKNIPNPSSQDAEYIKQVKRLAQLAMLNGFTGFDYPKGSDNSHESQTNKKQNKTNQSNSSNKIALSDNQVHYCDVMATSIGNMFNNAPAAEDSFSLCTYGEEDALIRDSERRLRIRKYIMDNIEKSKGTPGYAVNKMMLISYDNGYKMAEHESAMGR